MKTEDNTNTENKPGTDTSSGAATCSVDDGQCESCGGKMTEDKFSDCICKDGFYFSVTLISCEDCGVANNKDSDID